MQKEDLKIKKLILLHFILVRVLFKSTRSIYLKNVLTKRSLYIINMLKNYINKIQ